MDEAPDPTTPAPPDPGRAHIGLALTFLSIASGTYLLFFALAHSDRVERAMRAVRWEEAKRSKNFFWPLGHIQDDADRILNEEIPSVDHRRGGVYFFGTSNTQWAFKLWELPPEQRALIHNYGIPACGHAGQALLVRHLVDSEGLLDGGGEKTLAVFGAGYQNTGYLEDESSNLSVTLARRGFYARGPGGSIERSPVGRLERVASMERARVYGFAQGLAQTAKILIKKAIGRPSPVRVINPRELAFGRLRLMGIDWKANIHEKLLDLMGAVDYLRARGAKVVVVLMPEATWEDEIPFARAYHEELLGLCRAKGVKVVDLRRLVVDDDFADSTHLAPSGSEKYQRAILPICLDHLRSAGLLPEKGP